MDEQRTELARRIAQVMQRDGTQEPLPGLFLNRASSTAHVAHGVSIPAFCVIAQGSKEVRLGDDCFRYDPGHYLIATVELPIVIQVVDASIVQPYLSLRLNLDPTVVGAVMMEAGLPQPRGRTNVRAIDVSPIDDGLLDAALRLVRLVETPADAPILMPLITREIVYRLLRSAQGARLRHLTVLGGYSDRIARAIERLRNAYAQPLRVEHLAGDLGMSVSGFHAQFKAVTAMSPLQFQKQIRLQEARRLMLGEEMDAASAGLRVGYPDPSYFSREYKRHFGTPPMQDVQRLRAAARVSSEV